MTKTELQLISQQREQNGIIKKSINAKEVSEKWQSKNGRYRKQIKWQTQT